MIIMIKKTKKEECKVSYVMHWSIMQSTVSHIKYMYYMYIALYYELKKATFTHER